MRQHDAQACHLLAIAMVWRAHRGRMPRDRAERTDQTLRAPRALIASAIASHLAPKPKLTKAQMAELRQMVLAGPDTARP
jgi:hypothetical protein